PRLLPKPSSMSMALDRCWSSRLSGAPNVSRSRRERVALIPTTEVRMSSTQMSDEHATRVPGAERVDLKLEAVVIPVSDVDRSKRFYGSLGWRLDADFAFDNGFRV